MTGFLELPERSAKPRQVGITHVIDRGLSIADVDGLIEVAGDSVDMVKLGWGTALATGNLERKLARYREHGIPMVLGGSLTELAIAQGRLEQLVEWVKSLGIGYFEISDGTIALEHDRKLELIARLATGLHGPLGGRLQGRHRRDHAAVPVGRADAHGARRGRLEGDRRGARERHSRDLPAHRARSARV